jgi:hypothetical protein
MFCRIERERWDIIWINRVTDKATSGVRVEANHEKECEVMGVPERFEALVADLMVCGGVHQDHDQKHEVPCDAAGLRVMNLKCDFLADLCKTARHKYPHLYYHIEICGLRVRSTLMKLT